MILLYKIALFIIALMLFVILPLLLCHTTTKEYRNHRDYKRAVRRSKKKIKKN